MLSTQFSMFNEGKRIFNARAESAKSIGQRGKRRGQGSHLWLLSYASDSDISEVAA